MDRSRNTTVQDVFITKFGLVIRIKWTKTRQKGGKLALIPLPMINNSNLCPLKAWLEYSKEFKTYHKEGNNLLLTLDGSKEGILTASKCRKLLKQLLALTNLESWNYTPHSLRRGGAVFLFDAGTSIDDIKSHGLWTSNCVDIYLKENWPKSTRVVQCFANACQNL